MRPTYAAQPLVSCIMPTCNRRRFVRQAIHYFLSQDYAPKELIIIDDGTDVISDLVPNDERIRYFRLGEKATLGTKLNMACVYAWGTMIAHWDDDDWYAPRRLSYQVEALRHEGTDVCGINNLLYFDLRTTCAYQYIYPADQRVWLLGSSLCYTKRLWASNRFADINVGMDGLFVWATPPERITVLQDSTFSVFMIHGQNVSPKKTEGQWWHPYPQEEIQRLLGSDWDFYEPKEANSCTSLQAEFAVSHKRRECASVTPVRNIYACLVHESQECVIDLVRNLRYHDPSSTILLYNGGNDPRLLNDHFPFEQYGAIVHPSPRPMEWGSLHDFALDCMRFALESFSFDTLTIVDSDQLGVQSSYSHYLGQFLSGKSDVGMLGNSPSPLPATTDVAPGIQAFKEIDLWRPFLRRFTRGEDKFVHWTFWPGTVFTANAARDLTRSFATDKTLQDIVHRSKIWATEEIILPTLAALLGYKILENPCSYDFVKYRVSYALEHLESALSREDVYWVHPIPRQYGDILRGHIRTRCNNYMHVSGTEHSASKSETRCNHNLPLTLPILRAMKKVEGWLEAEEADLLIAISRRAIDELPQPHALVEIGSYCGRSTVVLGSVAREFFPQAKVYAIDPHEGKLGALDQGIHTGKPSLEALKVNIAEAGLTSVVEIIHSHSVDVVWDKPISLLLIDALHDFPNVSQDFYHFEPYVKRGGYILFHDYADYYPGVKAFVEEILTFGKYKRVHCVGSMMAVQKLSEKVVSMHVELPMQSKRPGVSGETVRKCERGTRNQQKFKVLDCRSLCSLRNLMSDTIWVYWEGKMPEYIVLCCKTIFAHNDNVVLLDRSSFDDLYTQERHLNIDELALNQKSDFIRAYLLKYYGGLYVDADCIVLKNLHPALEKAKQFGFLGYREPQGYMSCNFMASIREGEVISAHYERVCETLRSKRTLEWLDLASVPMNEVIDIYPDHSFLLPTDSVMPVAWDESEKLCVRRLDEEHEQNFNHEALCYMLSNNTIKSRDQTQMLSNMSEEQLLKDNYFISFLFRKSLNMGA